MAVTIVGKNERKCVEIDGSKFFYKRLNGYGFENARNSIAEVGKGGASKQKIGTYEIQKLKSCLVDWENVCEEDKDGKLKPIPFTKDKIGLLPSNIIEKLIDIIDGEEEVSKEDALD